jgi:hypothetical protein
VGSCWSQGAAWVFLKKNYIAKGCELWEGLCAKMSGDIGSYIEG